MASFFSSDDFQRLIRFIKQHERMISDAMKDAERAYQKLQPHLNEVVRASQKLQPSEQQLAHLNEVVRGSQKLQPSEQQLARLREIGREAERAWQRIQPQLELAERFWQRMGPDLPQFEPQLKQMLPDIVRMSDLMQAPALLSQIDVDQFAELADRFEEFAPARSEDSDAVRQLIAQPDFQAGTLAQKINQLARLAKLMRSALAVFLSEALWHLLIHYTVIVPIESYVTPERPTSEVVSDIRTPVLENNLSSDERKHCRIVSEYDVVVRQFPSKESEAIGRLYAGQIVHLIEERQPWAFVEGFNVDSNDAVRGWIEADHLASFDTP